MAPRRSTRASQISVIGGDVLDDHPAEIANGVFLPMTSASASGAFGEWEFSLVVTIRDRQPRCESLTIKRGRKDVPVTATVLREVPVALLVEMTMTGVFGTPFRLERGKRVPLSTQAAMEEREARQPRRQLMPRVVEEYRKAVANPATRSKPILTVAEELRYRPAYISKLVSEARKEGLLGPTSPGTSGERAHRVNPTGGEK